MCEILFIQLINEHSKIINTRNTGLVVEIET